jgi:hypothetical protein
LINSKVFYSQPSILLYQQLTALTDKPTTNSDIPELKKEKNPYGFDSPKRS